jgi:N-acyl-D-aspartate/D-glutamate deacylase
VLDLVIRGGEVVDGTGRPRRTADVGVLNGRIVAIGSISADAIAEIDASGKVVAPGFIDIHTHYDPHVLWNPMLTPSSLHGITTVFGGNCGFGLAPISEESADYLIPMLARVEGMPLAALQQGVDLTWTSYEGFLAHIEGRVGVNVGFLVGHTSIRRLVMGRDANTREATQDEVAKMVRLLEESLDAGGIGFSSSWGGSQTDHYGVPVPSRWAGREELLTLCSAVKSYPGTTLEFIPPRGEIFDEGTYELLASMSVSADRALNWNLLRVAADPASLASLESRIGASDYAAERGGRVVPLTLPEPLRVLVNLSTGFLYDTLPGWSETMFLPLSERLRAFGDPLIRERLALGAASVEPQLWSDWPNLRVASVVDQELLPHVGRLMVDLAAEWGITPLEALLDLVISDGGLTTFEASVVGDDDESWRLRVELAQDPRVVVGGSDAGAHLEMLQAFAYGTRFLADAVRERQLLSLEKAVQMFTETPARLYGLRDRGRIADGMCADLVVFDEAEIGPGTTEFRLDLPAGAGRLFSEPTGIDCVIVNGEVTIRENHPTGALAGKVLRAGTDTVTY